MTTPGGGSETPNSPSSSPGSRTPSARPRLGRKRLRSAGPVDVDRHPAAVDEDGCARGCPQRSQQMIAGAILERAGLKNYLLLHIVGSADRDSAVSGVPLSPGDASRASSPTVGSRVWALSRAFSSLRSWSRWSCHTARPRQERTTTSARTCLNTQRGLRRKWAVAVLASSADQIAQQAFGRFCDLVDCGLERLSVRSGRLTVTADLAHELKGCRPHFRRRPPGPHRFEES